MSCKDTNECPFSLDKNKKTCGCKGCCCPSAIIGPTGPTAPSIYAQQGKCRNHAAFSTLKTIKQPL